MIYSPTFFKYVYESWLEGHGRYPSTGFLSLLLAIHVCDEVSWTAVQYWNSTVKWNNFAMIQNKAEKWYEKWRENWTNSTEEEVYKACVDDVLLCLRHCALVPRPLQVSVFGFGADQYGNWHHYWEENHLAGAFRHTGVHDGDYEYNVTLLLADKHKIRMFKGRWYRDGPSMNCHSQLTFIVSSIDKLKELLARKN